MLVEGQQEGEIDYGIFNRKDCNYHRRRKSCMEAADLLDMELQQLTQKKERIW